MTKSNNSYKTTLQLIANILSFRPNAEQIKLQILQNKVDWEGLVKLSSSHLVLTTVYCRLKEKQLIQLLPTDLNDYIEKLTAINRNRNLSILQDIKDISTLLKRHNINYVFLKGCALLAGNYYKDLGERLIGDIDLLVDPTHIEDAYTMLASRGYSNSLQFNYENNNYRHLPRQIADDKLASIELHKHILNKEYEYLIDSKHMLLTKNEVNGMAIPNQNYLIQSLILADQINNNGHFYNTLNFKYAYDFLILNSISNKLNFTQSFEDKYISNYMGLMNIHFPEIVNLNNTFGIKKRRYFYILKLNSNLYRYMSYVIKNVILSITQRVKLFISNKSYRKNILQKI